MEAWAEGRRLRASPAVDFFAAAAAPQLGHGGRAREDITAGELLLEIPLEACLTPLRLLDLPAFMDEQQKLMLRLLQEVLVHGDRSQWKPYLDTLPHDFSTQPLWFTPAEVRLLRGTTVDSLLTGGHIANKRELEAILAWCASRPEVFPPEAGLGMDELRWAASVVASRAFDSTKAGVILAPFADALNHSGRRPHTRMRDGGEVLIFIAERKICAGEEVLNCYGERGNSQWLLNGGFVEEANPFEELLVTRPEVVSAALAYIGGSSGPGTEGGSIESLEEGTDEEGVEDRVGSRLAWMRQQRLVPDNSFAITSEDLLPDEMVTLLLVLCMGREALAEYQQRPPERRLVDISAEDLDELLLRDLYGAVLCLVELIEQRYDSSLEEDEALLERLFSVASAPTAAGSEEPQPAPGGQRPGPMPPPAKRHRGAAAGALNGAAVLGLEEVAAAAARVFGPDVRPENARNALLLRVGQKRLLRELRQRTQECFEADSEGEEEAGSGGDGMEEPELQ